MHVISKSFEFCYGHRVWTQRLFGEYADDLKCACRHLHGHEAKVAVHLESIHNRLDNTGMVTDFRHLEWLKRWLNEYVDHRFVIDRCDPLIHGLIGRALGYTGGFKDVKAGPEEIVCASQIHLDVFNPGTPEYEMAEGMLIVDFVPTSENLSKWIADIVAPNMAPLEVRVAKVEWWETPKSVSVYIPDKVEEIKIE